MRINPKGSKSLHVVAAVSVVAVLAGSLAARLLARPAVPPQAPHAVTTTVKPVIPRPAPATVPQPAPISLKDLEIPCWGCPGSTSWPVTFKTNLDLLAPLGNGSANAAVWFKDFAKPSGSRYAEAEAAMKRRVDGGRDVGMILPPNDPLLLEAELWCDQATLRFYPDFLTLKGLDFLALKGLETPLPNLMLPITLARSWLGNARAATDPGKALEDCRRAVRLGRLLRQDNVTVIADIVGVAAIRLGALGIYEIAVKQGNLQLAVVAAIVIGEHGPQRLFTAEHLTKIDVAPYLRHAKPGDFALELPDAKLNAIVQVAKDDPDRRFRCEAIVTLNIVRHLGTQAQQERTLKLLDEIAHSDDPILAASAAWARDNAPGKEYLEAALKPMP